MRPSNTGIGYTDDMAVQAVVDFRASDEDLFFTPTDPLPLVRTSYHNVITEVLSPGLYHFTIAVEVAGAAAGTDVAADVEFDGVPLGTILSAAGTAGGGFLLSATVPQVFATTATHTVEYFAWQTGGPNTASAKSAITTWVRERA